MKYIVILLVLMLSSCATHHQSENAEVGHETLISDTEIIFKTEDQIRIEVLENQINSLQEKYNKLSVRDQKLAKTYDRLLGDYRLTREKVITAIDHNRKLFEKYTNLMTTFQKIVESNEDMRVKLKEAAKENSSLKGKTMQLQKENFKLKNQVR